MLRSHHKVVYAFCVLILSMVGLGTESLAQILPAPSPVQAKPAPSPVRVCPTRPCPPPNAPIITNLLAKPLPGGPNFSITWNNPVLFRAIRIRTTVTPTITLSGSVSQHTLSALPFQDPSATPIEVAVKGYYYYYRLEGAWTQETIISLPNMQPQPPTTVTPTLPDYNAVTVSLAQPDYPGTNAIQDWIVTYEGMESGAQFTDIIPYDPNGALSNVNLAEGQYMIKVKTRANNVLSATETIVGPIAIIPPPMPYQFLETVDFVQNTFQATPYATSNGLLADLSSGTASATNIWKNLIGFPTAVLQINPTTQNNAANNRILFTDPAQGNGQLEPSLLALAGFTNPNQAPPTHTTGSRFIIILNHTKPWITSDIYCANIPVCSAQQNWLSNSIYRTKFPVRSTLLHELGHVFGMQHDFTTVNSVMNPTTAADDGVDIFLRSVPLPTGADGQYAWDLLFPPEQP